MISMGFSRRLLAWFRNNPIRTYFVFVSIAVLPLALFLLIAHNLLNRQATARIVAQSSQSGKLFGTLLEQQLTENLVFLQSVAMRPDMGENWQSGKYGAISASLSQLHELRPDFLSLGIYDLNGTLRAVAPAPAEGLNQNFASRDWYAGVRRAWKPYISAVYPSGGSNHLPIVAVTVPLFDQHHNPIAIITGRQTLETVTKGLYGMLSAQNANLVFIVDQQDQVFGKQSGARAVTLLPQNREVAEALKNHSAGSTGRIISSGEQSFVTSFSPLAGIGWGILIEVPVATIRSTVWDYERNLGILGIVIILLAVGGGALVARLYKQFRDAEHGYLQQIESKNLELQQRTAELEETNEALETFSYSVSHDLRAPLRGISGLGSVLVEDYSGQLDKTARDYLYSMIAAAKKMNSLITSLLAYSRLTRSSLTSESEAVNLAVAIQDAREQLDNDILRAGAEIYSTGSFPAVRGNRVLLAQAIANLLANAVKYVRQGTHPKIDISAEEREGKVRLWIRDNGIGIASQDRDKVFKAFERLHGPEHYSGSGLGLAIVSKAIERMAGQVGFESQPGQGSQFWIELPLAAG